MLYLRAAVQTESSRVGEDSGLVVPDSFPPGKNFPCIGDRGRPAPAQEYRREGPEGYGGRSSEGDGDSLAGAVPVA